MSAHYSGHGVTVYHGDSLDVLRELAPESVEAVVTDPPYELSFMGRRWDGTGVAFDPDTWRLVLHVLKPGGHLLAFGGTRMWHRLACAIEDAGFEIRDNLAWMYGSGFPKSLDVSKAIDRAAGGERARYERPAFGGTFSDDNGTTYGTALVDQPATPDAERWQGWGTALKPAYEPIVLARKPLAGTVAGNVLAHGTGALNIDACRVGMSEADGMGGFGRAGWSRADGTLGDIYEGTVDGSLAQINARAHDLGRWPANVILDDTAAAQLDQQSGDGVSRIGKPRGADHGDGWGMTATGAEYADSGGASRFFYTPKADATERPRVDGVAHPTVKPLDLMRWLVRLVTQPGGTVLDPFAGSGTTVEACLLEGFRCVAVEREADYLPLIVSRVTRQRDPVAYVNLAGSEAPTLFDDFAGGVA